MRKQMVILDTAREMEIFLEQLKGMPYMEEFSREAVTTIVDYMGDLDYSKGSLLEYIDESINMHESADLGNYTFNPAGHRAALMRIGTFIHNELVRNGLYVNGALWFEVGQFLGNDVVLQELTKESIVN